MGVKLRVKKYKSGTQTYYLDININNLRTFEFLDIKVGKKTSSDDKKQKKELAEKIRAKRELEIEYNQHGFIPKHRKKVIFNDYYQSFLDSYRKNDLRIYKYAFVKFCEHIQNKRIAAGQINEQLIEGYRDYLQSKESGLHGETPYDYFSRFKRLLKKAYKDGLIDPGTFNNISEISIKRHGNYLNKQILNIEELRVLKITECANKEVKRAFLFSCFTGLGEAEIRKLTWRKILQERKITLFREKSGEQIINDLPQSAMNLLGDRGATDELIFKLPSNVAVLKNLKNWVKKAEIEKNISFYCGRHSFAVQLLRNGANLKTVADCLGHTSTKHTMKYLYYVDDLKEKAISNLPSI